MTIEELFNRWNEMNNSQEYLQRLDSSHPLDFFVGIDSQGNKELVLLSPDEPSQMKSSKSIVVEKGKRRDGQWAIQIKLVDENNKEVFCSLCMDLVDSTYQIDNKLKGMQAVIGRFIKWQKLLESGTGGMRQEVIKGLVGELYFAMKILTKRYTWEEIVDSWVGPDGSDRDFVFHNEWFEVKAVSIGKQSVGISSLNQLEIEQNGYLVIVSTDVTNKADSKSFSFVSIIEDFKAVLKEKPSTLEQFEEKLFQIGYYEKKEYSDIYFAVTGTNLFLVNKEFPRLTPKLINNAIVSAKYDIDIAKIQEWKVGTESIWN